MSNAAVPVQDIATLATGSAASINAQMQSRDNSCTGLGFITSHGLREYEVKKLRSPAFCG